ncbi:MAG: hypothetical protein ACF8NJ_04910 [Phycisphaerales bacterium JB038]
MTRNEHRNWRTWVHRRAQAMNGNREKRRGIAMLLVLVCLATMAVMTAAYLSAHGNAGVIAENATEVVETEIASRTASDLAEAVLQAEKDLTPTQVKSIFQDHNLGDLTITAQATTFEGTDPSGEAEPLLITVEAKNGARRHRFQKAAKFEPSQDIAVNLDDMDWAAGEFALFGANSVTIEQASTLTRWASSPQAALGKPLKLGSNSESSGCVTLKSEAVVTGGQAFLLPTASATALDNATAFDSVSREDLPSGLPIVGALIPYTGEIPTWADGGLELWWGCTETLTGNALRYDWSVLTDTACLTLEAVTQLAIADDLQIDGATLRIDGQATIFVFGNMTLRQGAVIELTEGSSLDLVIGGNLTVNGSAIGFAREILAAGPAPSTDLPYADPNAIRIVAGHSDHKHWHIENGSLVRGRIYSPTDCVTIKTASALYGCALGLDVKLLDASCVHYDHSLDCEIGYTATDGPLYDATDGELIDAVLTAVRNCDFTAAEDAVVLVNGDSTEAPAEGAEAAPEITVRKLARCIARPRPTKARKYEGQPLAHAEEDAQ